MSEVVVRFVDVKKNFGKAPVLRGVTLAVTAGEFLGLAGLNGAGKTTLIKSMLDLTGIDAGRIELFGRPHRDPRSRARLAFLPERFMAPYYLTGRDFLRFASGAQGVAFNEVAAVRMLEALDLDASAMHKPVRSYSKGMTQKLGLAATFLADRDLYVLDEPMSGLDPKARACVKNLLFGLRERSRTVLFTSHALADIEEICDRVVVLHRGVPYFAGPPRELCQHYGQIPIEQAFLACIEASDG